MNDERIRGPLFKFSQLTDEEFKTYKRWLSMSTDYYRRQYFENMRNIRYDEPFEFTIIVNHIVNFCDSEYKFYYDFMTVGLPKEFIENDQYSFFKKASVEVYDISDLLSSGNKSEHSTAFHYSYIVSQKLPEKVFENQKLQDTGGCSKCYINNNECICPFATYHCVCDEENKAFKYDDDKFILNH